MPRDLFYFTRCCVNDVIKKRKGTIDADEETNKKQKHEYYPKDEAKDLLLPCNTNNNNNETVPYQREEEPTASEDSINWDSDSAITDDDEFGLSDQDPIVTGTD